MNIKHISSIILLLLITISFVLQVSATETITVDSVYQPENVTKGMCSELCSGSENESVCQECRTNCGCEYLDDTCIHMVPYQDKVIIYFFYSLSCPHCQTAHTFFEQLQTERNDFILKEFEVSHNQTNIEFAKEFCEERNIPFQSVPTIFVGDAYFIGFNDEIKDEIIEAIDSVKSDPVEIQKQIITVPFLGSVDATTLSLPLLTVLLGFLDGFNPCAFFILLFLLNMLTYAKSRKRMIIIGGTFVLISGIVYFIFMAAWLNFFLVTSSIGIITLIAGIVAFIMGLINVKDFFAFKKGVSLSISDEHRSKLIKKMRNLLKAESLPIMLIGTILLAVSANMYELLCTAGFPMVFTKALTLNNFTGMQYYSYLALYNLVYVLPLLVIVIVFTWSMGGKKLSEETGQTLKLMSGMMMLGMGCLLMFKPEWLTNPIAAIGFIIGAIIITVVTLLIKKYITQYTTTKKKKKERITENKNIKEN